MVEVDLMEEDYRAIMEWAQFEKSAIERSFGDRFQIEVCSPSRIGQLVLRIMDKLNRDHRYLAKLEDVRGVKGVPEFTIFLCEPRKLRLFGMGTPWITSHHLWGVDVRKCSDVFQFNEDDYWKNAPEGVLYNTFQNRVL